MSLTGPTLPSRTLQEVGSYLRYTDQAARDDAEVEPIVDHGEAAAGGLRPTAFRARRRRP
jgi:hypothetical protein